jgi:transcriptional regulator with XRE-family HTH domain
MASASSSRQGRCVVPNLPRLLAVRRWTQADLARAMDRSVAFVNQVFLGDRDNPTNRTLQRFADAFGVPRHVLLNDGLSEQELRDEISRGALRAATEAGVEVHQRAMRLVGTPQAPLSVEEWATASLITGVVVGPYRRRPDRSALDRSVQRAHQAEGPFTRPGARLSG